jgi:NTE family protein
VLVDGGVVDNMPVAVVRDMGADLVVAVDVSTPHDEASRVDDVLDVASHLSSVLIEARNHAYRANADVTIRPKLGDHSFLDYSDFDELVEAGYRAARERLVALSGSTGAGSSRRRRSERNGEKRVIHRVEVSGNENVQGRLIAEDFGIRAGEDFDLQEALVGADRVFATGLFEASWLDAEGLGEEVALTLHVEEKEPRALEIGLAYNEDIELQAFAELHNRNVLGWGEHLKLTVLVSDREAGVRARALGRRLWRGRLGLDLSGELWEDRPRLFEEGEFIGRAEFDRKAAWIGGQLSFGASTLSWLGLREETVGIGPDVLPNTRRPEDHFRRLRLGFLADTVDDPQSPRRGGRVSFTLEKNLLGSIEEERFWRMASTLHLAAPIRERSVLETEGLLVLSGGELPVSELARIGGPVLVPGLYREELSGAQAAAVSLGYRVFLSPNFWVGGRVSAGNAWDEREEVSLRSLRPGAALTAQYDTRFGPLRVDFGVTESGTSRIYFSAGYP